MSGLLLLDVSVNLLASVCRRRLLVDASASRGDEFSRAVFAPAEECVVIGLLARNAPAVRHPTLLAGVPLVGVQLLLPAAEAMLLAS